MGPSGVHMESIWHPYEGQLNFGILVEAKIDPQNESEPQRHQKTTKIESDAVFERTFSVPGAILGDFIRFYYIVGSKFGLWDRSRRQKYSKIYVGLIPHHPGSIFMYKTPIPKKICENQEKLIKISLNLQL